MIRTSSPKVLWDDCLELEAEIRSSTASNIFKLEGEVLKTVMNGETSNIPQLCEIGWYDWVYFHDNAVTYPDDKWVLGLMVGTKYWGWSTLCAKLIKSNGQRVYRLSYRHSMEDEVNNPEEVKKRDDFDRQIKIKLGPATKSLDFDDEGQTPVFQLYEDDDDGVIGHAKKLRKNPPLYH